MQGSNDHSTTKFIVGAYAAAPSLRVWDAAAEGRFLDSVLALDGVAGLEVPFDIGLHKDDEPWFLQHLPSGRDYIVTTIPGTMARLQNDPLFGLASTSEAGRRAALEFVAEALEAVIRLGECTSEAVRALEIHAAPVADGNGASVAALADSLTEISDWEWHGAQIVLEHCDAFRSGHSPAKGFMTLAAEAEAVSRVNERSGRSIGLSVNWGRSVIEERRPDAALEHITFLRAAGLLAGLVLSGCAGVDTRYGPAWGDVHVPPAPDLTQDDEDVTGAIDVLEPASLMTVARVRECLDAAGAGNETGFRGVKVAADPQASAEERVATIAQTIALVQRAANG